MAMFEAEVEMEKRSSFLPLVLLLALVATLVGLVAYVALEVRAKKDLSAAEAAPFVQATLRSQGAAVLHFRVGKITYGMDEKPADPHFRLLEKLGMVKISNRKPASIVVNITAQGERMVSSIPRWKKNKTSDGIQYVVPLAEREMVEIASVKMKGPNDAVVEYTWKWAPNELGAKLDASSPLAKSFNTWERSTLIDKYGVDFYGGPPVRATIALARIDRVWKIAE
jgi:hypothetical protein